jgi:hypothetical protein
MKHFSREEEEEEGVVMVVIVLLLLLLLLLLLVVVLLLPRPHTAAIRGAGMLDAPRTTHVAPPPPRCRVGASRGARRNGEGGAEKAHGVGDEAPGTNTGGRATAGGGARGGRPA